MTPSITRARTSATDGEWMDVGFAAMYAGVTRAVITQALNDGELLSSAASGRLLSRRVHSHAVEAWAAERESGLVGSAQR
jgi:hypothetical protein